MFTSGPPNLARQSKAEEFRFTRDVCLISSPSLISALGGPAPDRVTCLSKGSIKVLFCGYKKKGNL